MKHTYRGLLYHYCTEYIRTLTLRQELFFHDDDMECTEIQKRLENELMILEKGLLDTLQKE